MEYYGDYYNYDVIPSYTDSLMHYGVPGMKWGVRKGQGSPRSYGSRGSGGRRLSKRQKALLGAAGAAAVAGGIAYAAHRRKQKNPGNALAIYKPSESSNRIADKRRRIGGETRNMDTSHLLEDGSYYYSKSGRRSKRRVS